MSVNTGGGSSLTGDVRAGNDFVGRDHDDRSVNVSFAPSEATLRPGVVYTIQEMFAAMEKKLDEHSWQLQAIWQKVVSIEFEQAALKREFDEMKDCERYAQDQQDKRHQRTLILWFRIATVVGMLIIISMLWWMVRHIGGL